MNAETDPRTKWATLSRYTGHSVRYLRIRAAVRAAVVTVPLVGGLIVALLP